MVYRDSLVAAGVRNLKEFGYPDVDAENILKDVIYSKFFLNMLRDNLGLAGKNVDDQINILINEIEAEG